MEVCDAVKSHLKKLVDHTEYLLSSRGGNYAQIITKYHAFHHLQYFSEINVKKIFISKSISFKFI